MHKEVNADPYIVSADVNRLIQNWAKENGYAVPNSGYFHAMLNDLEQVLCEYFESVHVVPERYIAAGMEGMARRSKLPVISLDRAYIGSDTKNLVGYMDITRTVNEDLVKQDISERPGSPPIDQQIDAIVKSLETNKVALLDDVLFEGGTHSTVAEWFAKRGIIVEEVCAGIAIEEGVEALAKLGIKVHSLLGYDKVVDEICERDFVAGVPMSGRTVMGANRESLGGAPYFYPFGNPESWASIPSEHAVAFSDFCLAQSIMMWAKIEKLSERSISTSEVPKPVYTLAPNASISAALKSLYATE